MGDSSDSEAEVMVSKTSRTTTTIELSDIGDSQPTQSSTSDVDIDWKAQSSGPQCGCSDDCLNTAIPFIGNVLEWFDFAVFGYMTSFLSAAFFPGDDPIASTMSTFSVFAGAFFMRPVGGLIFGHVGDTIGRKRALMASIILMVCFSSVFVNARPSHADIRGPLCRRVQPPQWLVCRRMKWYDAHPCPNSL